MSHRDRDRDRRDDRRKEYDSSRRGGREYDRDKDRDYGHGRRRSRSTSPRRREGRDRRDGYGRRSRSRSPRRDISRDRDREYDRRREDRRPDRRKDERREAGRDARGDSKRDEKSGEEKMVAESNPPAPAEEMSEEAMMAMMGFGSFGTTKGQHVEGNQEGGVKINRQQTWRQYMNRRGGFNRPLDKVK